MPDVSYFIHFGNECAIYGDVYGDVWFYNVLVSYVDDCICTPCAGCFVELEASLCAWLCRYLDTLQRLLYTLFRLLCGARSFIVCMVMLVFRHIADIVM